MAKYPKLQSFLNEPSNTRTREKMFFHRLYFELKLAAAAGGSHLGLYEPDVDRDGFDVVLTDRDTTRQIQLKTATRSSGTSRWSSGLRFLRPEFQHIQAMGFEFSPAGEGRDGGIIAAIIDDTDPACPLTYYYTDLYVLNALSAGILREERTVKRKNELTRRHLAKQALMQLHGRDLDGEIKIPRKCFLRAESSVALLHLIGLNFYSDPVCGWADHVRVAVEGRFETDANGRPDSGIELNAVLHAEMAGEALKKLTVEPRLSAFVRASSAAS